MTALWYYRDMLLRAFNVLWFRLDLPELGMPKERRGFLRDQIRQLEAQYEANERAIQEVLRQATRLDGLMVRAGEKLGMSGGVVLTSAVIDRLAEEAEAGYDPSRLVAQ